MWKSSYNLLCSYSLCFLNFLCAWVILVKKINLFSLLCIIILVFSFFLYTCILLLFLIIVCGNFRYGAFWHMENVMVNCLNGLKQLYTAVINFCDADLCPQPWGLQHPEEALARETGCMFLSSYFFSIYKFWNFN